MFNSLSFKVIIFGFIFTFFSSFGQSFFLGLFNSSIRETLSITHGQFGSIYASATLLSSLVLVWVGKKIDDINIYKFSSYVIIFLSISCFIFSTISSIIMLFTGIFLMRLAGQGLTTHTATTTVSRFFEKNRGKALSSCWLGLSLAEFILPVLIVFLLTLINWREIWFSISIIVIIILPIVNYVLIRDIRLDTREENKNPKILKSIKQWKRNEVLKDYRFYIICMTMLATPWIATGSFVYQSFIASSKGWGPYIIAQSFMSYSIFTVMTLFVSGYLIDKFTSKKLLLFINIPLLISVIILIFFDSPISSFFFLGLMGISNAFSNVLGSSTWAEIYGVKYIGSIKAMTTGFMVFSTAFGTAIFGILIDNGYSVKEIALILAIYILSSVFFLFIIRKKLNPLYL